MGRILKVTQDQNLDTFIKNAMALAKQYGDVHQTVIDSGPFQVVPDGYVTLPLIDPEKFTPEQIALLEAAIEKRAQKENITGAGLSFLKMLLTIIFTGLKIGGLAI